eukprot:6470038-Amphidinium_carterae.1
MQSRVLDEELKPRPVRAGQGWRQCAEALALACPLSLDLPWQFSSTTCIPAFTLETSALIPRALPDADRKKLFENILTGYRDWDLHIWTDGSFKILEDGTSIAGGGFLIRDNIAGDTHQDHCAFNSGGSSYWAELQALRAALLHARQVLLHTRCSVAILTDSASLLNQFKALPGKAPSEIHDIVNYLSELLPTRVRIQHVPAHCGHATHDVVDGLASVGLLDRTLVTGTVPIQAVRSFARHRVLSDWIAADHTSGHLPTYLQARYQGVLPRRLTPVLSLGQSRWKDRALAQFRLHRSPALHNFLLKVPLEDDADPATGKCSCGTPDGF